MSYLYQAHIYFFKIISSQSIPISLQSQQSWYKYNYYHHNPYVYLFMFVLFIVAAVAAAVDVYRICYNWMVRRISSYYLFFIKGTREFYLSRQCLLLLFCLPFWIFSESLYCRLVTLRGGGGGGGGGAFKSQTRSINKGIVQRKWATSWIEPSLCVSS